MADLRERGVVADLAVEIGVLHDDAGGVAIDKPAKIFAAARRRILRRNFLAGEPRIGLADRAVMRMQPARQHGLVAPCDAARHRDCLGAGGGAVIERGVGDLHAGQQRDLRLKLEQVLQCPLRQLGLVRGVGGQELAALDQVIDRGRHVMAIAAGAEKERHHAGNRIFRRHRAEAPLDLELAHRARQVQQPVVPRRLRHLGKQIIDRLDADRRQHVAPVGIGQRQIAHQGCSPTKL